MTKTGVLNIFAVIRSVGLAVAITGVVFLLIAALVAEGVLLGGARLSFALTLGADAASLATAGLALTLSACLVRVFVSWTRFQTD